MTTIRRRLVARLAPATVAIAETACRTGGTPRRDVLDRARAELGLPPAKDPPRRRA